MNGKQKVAILTNFNEFNPGYSLTGIVLDQARMLRRHGHEVSVFVNEQFNRTGVPEDIDFRSEITFAHLVDYRSVNDLSEEHQQTIENMVKHMSVALASYDIVYTHDFIFTGWNMPYALAVQKIGKKLPKLAWMHWVHSTPSAMSDWWDINRYGSGHRIIFPNRTEKVRVAEQFRGKPEQVRAIPHIKDLRSWWDFSQDAWDFIDEYPSILRSEIVQVYPASSDRLTAKRLDLLIQIFGKIKRRSNMKVCLVCANQWATGTQPKEDIQRFIRIAARNGLKYGEEFIFTSEWRHEDERKIVGNEPRRFPTGLPKSLLRELWLCSNLFIFPTREESFGLVGPEASLTAGMFLVLNKSLLMMHEVHGLNGLYVDFGSFHMQFHTENEDNYYTGVADLILGRMRENEAVMARTWHRIRYNMDAIYENYYMPIMAESIVW